MAVTDLLEREMYSYSDVDRILGLSSGTARRWLDGYERAGEVYGPDLRPERTGSDAVTWGEMVEARLLAGFRGRRVPLQKLRPAVRRLRQEFGLYPLAMARPFLDVAGRELVRRVQDEVDLDRALRLVVVRNDQLLLDAPVERFASSASYVDGSVSSMQADSRTPSVLLDPRQAFGQPSVRGVRTDVLAEDYRAGEPVPSIAELYDLSEDQVGEALRFELIVAAA